MENGADPTCFFLKLFKSAFTKEIFNLNNKGNHHRDFTYIGDIFSLINLLMIKKTKNMMFIIFVQIIL